jgi:hypothetical protein
MLIGLERKFIFIANLKSASTAIEDVLRPVSEIALSSIGKHWPLRTIEERFGWVFDIIDRHDILIFGVMRDPSEYIVSLYNSHAHIGFRRYPSLYTGDMCFDKFMTEWIPNNTDLLAPQFHRFLTREGRIGANYIISYGQLNRGLDYVANIISYPQLRRLDYTNVSYHRICPDHLSESQLEWIAEQFKQDYEFMARFCDRVIPSNVFPFDRDMESPTVPRINDLSSRDNGYAAAIPVDVPESGLRATSDTEAMAASLGRQLMAALESPIERSAGDRKCRSLGERLIFDMLLKMRLLPRRGRRQELDSQAITLGKAATTHMRLITWCKTCGHQVELNMAEEVARYGEATTIVDRVRRLQCPACGGRNSDFMISAKAR